MGLRNLSEYRPTSERLQFTPVWVDPLPPQGTIQQTTSGFDVPNHIAHLRASVDARLNFPVHAG
jgi:hypothetical protein